MRLFVETWYTQEIFFRKEQSPERTLRRARTNYFLLWRIKVCLLSKKFRYDANSYLSARPLWFPWPDIFCTIQWPDDPHRRPSVPLVLKIQMRWNICKKKTQFHSNTAHRNGKEGIGTLFFLYIAEIVW